ncbi:MAG TPA: hypothetical protein VMG12_26745 [Polyangiaceae bacterium]|nr:hypothetical protein [Polyangiaceae bacterium]
MASPRLDTLPRAPFTSRRAAQCAGIAFGVALASGWLAGCAGLLGIEDATCDPSYDPRCTNTSVGMLTPVGGSGGRGVMTGGSSGNGGSAVAAGSGGAAGGNVAGAGGAPTMEEPVEESLCERYCDTVAAACTGDNEQYASLMACTAVCNLLDAGEPGDLNNNTVECRLARAELAQATGEASSYCHTAGPGGGGVCGSDCEGFCTLMAAKCSLMGDYEQCLPLCEDVPNRSDVVETDTYRTAIQSGDSVQCRLYHVSAATLDPIMHCSHAAGVALCVPSSVN